MILKYQKVTDTHTTHTLAEPDYAEDDGVRCVELATIGNDTYVYVPDAVVLPDQPFAVDVSLEQVTLTSELLAEIKAVSPHVRLINRRVVEKIRLKYDENAELKATHGVDTRYSDEFYAYRATCIAWGDTQKANIGLG